MVKHLNLVLTCGVEQEPLTFAYLAAPLKILRQTEDNASFCSVLLKQGVVTVLTSLIAKFASRPRAEDILTSCFLALAAKVQVIPAYPWIEEALKAGPLQAIVLSETHNPCRLVSEHVTYFLRVALPRASVYFPVVVQIAPTLEDVKTLATAASFLRYHIGANSSLSQTNTFVP